ncbi:hypothetical protein [Serratia sp. (in: enterobacteria)]|uniref:hypothetical protein n=1 Tax=Serratia sp. (in: enterobacteria) TaxID=616 RepID=UPI003989729F
MSLFDKGECRKCRKKFDEHFQPSMIARSLVFDTRWVYLCNDCALQTSYLWDNRGKENAS